MSLGTGEKTFKKVNPSSMNVVSFIAKMGEFMMNMDAYSASSYLENFMPLASTHYIRMQTTSDIGMDVVDKKSMDALKADGAKLWKENETQMKQILRDIIDERFAPEAVQTTPSNQALDISQ